MESRVPAIIDALIATFTPAVPDGIRVVDGPQLSDQMADYLFVGYDADPESEFQSAFANQEWAGLGARKRNEQVTIHCAVYSTDGNNNVKRSRDRVYSVVDAAGAALRADPSLGLAPPCVAGLVPQALYHYPTDAGLESRLTFEVRVNTRV